jgi:hypothetical protein
LCGESENGSAQWTRKKHAKSAQKAVLTRHRKEKQDEARRKGAGINPSNDRPDPKKERGSSCIASSFSFIKWLACEGKPWYWNFAALASLRCEDSARHVRGFKLPKGRQLIAPREILVSWLDPNVHRCTAT